MRSPRIAPWVEVPLVTNLPRDIWVACQDCHTQGECLFLPTLRQNRAGDHVSQDRLHVTCDLGDMQLEE